MESDGRFDSRFDSNAKKNDSQVPRDKTPKLRGLEMKPGLWVSNFGRVGSRVSVSDPVFDPVLSFSMRVYHGTVPIQSNIMSW